MFRPVPTMTRTARRLSSLFLLLAVVGCHRCGDRPRLLGRLRDRNPDDDGDRRGVDRFRERAPDHCDDALPPPRRTGTDSYGQPVSNGSGRYVSPISGIPYSNPLPTGGFPAGPSYPYGTPIPIGGPLRDNELPNPGGFNIPPAFVPAGLRPTDGGKLFPPPGGGIVTGDPRK